MTVMQVLSVVASVGLGAWLVLMVMYPGHWERIVDADRRFWASTGILRVLPLEWTWRFEKSVAFKMVAGVMFAVWLALTIFTLAT